MSWTETGVTELKRLWVAGIGTKEIGEQLGMSKNAIIGKAHRIGLQQRRASPRRGKADLLCMSGPRCQWPTGDPGQPDFHMCGAAALDGKPYCATHYARAYITPSRSRDRSANAA